MCARVGHVPAITRWSVAHSRASDGHATRLTTTVVPQGAEATCEQHRHEAESGEHYEGFATGLGQFTLDRSLRAVARLSLVGTAGRRRAAITGVARRARHVGRAVRDRHLLGGKRSPAAEADREAPLPRCIRTGEVEHFMAITDQLGIDEVENAGVLVVAVVDHVELELLARESAGVPENDRGEDLCQLAVRDARSADVPVLRVDILTTGAVAQLLLGQRNFRVEGHGCAHRNEVADRLGDLAVRTTSVRDRGLEALLGLDLGRAVVDDLVLDLDSILREVLEAPGPPLPLLAVGVRGLGLDAERLALLDGVAVDDRLLRVLVVEHEVGLVDDVHRVTGDRRRDRLACGGLLRDRERHAVGDGSPARGVVATVVDCLELCTVLTRRKTEVLGGAARSGDRNVALCDRSLAPRGVDQDADGRVLDAVGDRVVERDGALLHGADGLLVVHVHVGRTHRNTGDLHVEVASTDRVELGMHQSHLVPAGCVHPEGVLAAQFESEALEDRIVVRTVDDQRPVGEVTGQCVEVQALAIRRHAGLGVRTVSELVSRRRHRHLRRGDDVACGVRGGVDDLRVGVGDIRLFGCLGGIGFGSGCCVGVGLSLGGFRIGGSLGISISLGLCGRSVSVCLCLRSLGLSLGGVGVGVGSDFRGRCAVGDGGVIGTRRERRPVDHERHEGGHDQQSQKRSGDRLPLCHSGCGHSVSFVQADWCRTWVESVTYL